MANVVVRRFHLLDAATARVLLPQAVICPTVGRAAKATTHQITCNREQLYKIKMIFLVLLRMNLTMVVHELQDRLLRMPHVVAYRGQMASHEPNPSRYR